MVLFAALTLVGLMERGVPVPLALALTTLGDDRAGLRHRAGGAAAARQPGAHHPVHGDHRPELLPRRASARCSGAPTSRSSTSASPTSRSWSAGVQINQLELTAALTAGRAGGRPGRLLPADADRPRAARGGRRPRGGAVDRHPAQDDLGRRVVGGRHRGHRGRDHVGRQERRAVQPVAHRAQGACRSSSWAASSRSPAPSSAASSSASARRSARSTGARSSAAPSRTGSPTSWPSPSCCSARRACSAKRSSSAYDVDETPRDGDASRGATTPAHVQRRQPTTSGRHRRPVVFRDRPARPASLDRRLVQIAGSSGRARRGVRRAAAWPTSTGCRRS